MILCVRTTPPISRKTQGLSSPSENPTSRSSRGNAAHISSEKAAIREPPHVGCYFLNRLSALFRAIRVAFCLAGAGCAAAAVMSEDCGTGPAQRGWRTCGDAAPFSWEATHQDLAVTWDSSHTNSFFYRSLGTVLTTGDDFSFSFDLRLSDLRVGSTPGKSNEFEIAVGLLNYRSATNANAFRGAGVSPTYGVRNIVEFDYFPDAGLGATFATTVISSNNVFAYAHNDPLTLSLGDTFRLTLSYTASDQVLRTSALKNGAPFGPLGDVSLAGKPDFRVDSFAVTSYSDAIQLCGPQYFGSILAHVVLDNVALVVPPPPLGKISLRQTNAAWLVEFNSLTNWVYTLEGSTNFSAWLPAGPATTGHGPTLRFPDSPAAPPTRFYRAP